jgi:hypothetical protein
VFIIAKENVDTAMLATIAFVKQLSATHQYWDNNES